MPDAVGTAQSHISAPGFVVEQSLGSLPVAFSASASPRRSAGIRSRGGSRHQRQRRDADVAADLTDLVWECGEVYVSRKPHRG